MNKNKIRKWRKWRFVMNHIGIIGAMEEEVRCLKDQLRVSEVVSKASMEFYKGTLNGKDIVVVQSGIGKVNAAICAQILVDDFKVEAIINTGIAGGLVSQIDIGDIVISKDVIHHDMDATGFGYEPGVIPRMKTSIFEADESLIQLAKEVCEEVNKDISTHIGRVVTGDQFISSHEKKAFLLETFQGYCAEMEGAAIAQTAYLNQIPFLIVRAISDKADNSASVDYPKFEKKAIEHAVGLVNGMLDKM